jgi:hypothetical protein
VGALGGWLALWNLFSQALVTFIAFPFLYAGKFHQNDSDLLMVALHIPDFCFVLCAFGFDVRKGCLYDITVCFGKVSI